MFEKFKEKMIAKFQKNSSTIIILSITFAYLIITSFFGAGFAQNKTVTLDSFKISEDGKTMTIDIAVPSEYESVRKMTYIPSGDAYFVDFIYSFGIGPFIFGEKEEFTFELEENTKGIFFLRDNEYELVLYKDDETKEWLIVSELEVKE